MWLGGVGKALSIADSFVCRHLTSVGPDLMAEANREGTWLEERFLHSLVEQHPTEVGRFGNGVLCDPDH